MSCPYVMGWVSSFVIIFRLYNEEVYVKLSWRKTIIHSSPSTSTVPNTQSRPPFRKLRGQVIHWNLVSRRPWPDTFDMAAQPTLSRMYTGIEKNLSSMSASIFNRRTEAFLKPYQRLIVAGKELWKKVNGEAREKADNHAPAFTSPPKGSDQNPPRTFLKTFMKK